MEDKESCKQNSKQEKRNEWLDELYKQTCDIRISLQYLNSSSHFVHLHVHLKLFEKKMKMFELFLRFSIFFFSPFLSQAYNHDSNYTRPPPRANFIVSHGHPNFYPQQVFINVLVPVKISLPWVWYAYSVRQCIVLTIFYT